MYLSSVSCRNSSFDSLLKQYSSYKNKQLGRKARSLLGGSSIKLVESNKKQSRELEDNQSDPILDEENDPKDDGSVHDEIETESK
jgi:hypothetical protein